MNSYMKWHKRILFRYFYSVIYFHSVDSKDGLLIGQDDSSFSLCMKTLDPLSLAALVLSIGRARAKSAPFHTGSGSTVIPGLGLFLAEELNENVKSGRGF